MSGSSGTSGRERPVPPDAQTSRSIWESPWYWLYLFATAGLIGLLLIGPKYAARQAQIESSGLKRQRAALQVRGKELPAEEDTPGHDIESSTEISLRPLCALLGILLIGGSAGVVWHQWRRGPSQKLADSLPAERPDQES